MFSLEELQKMNKNELIRIIGNYVSDQEILLNQAKELEKQNDRKSAEIEQLMEKLTNEHNTIIAFQEIADENRRKIWEEVKAKAELQKQVDELKFDKEILQKLIDKREKDTAKEILTDIDDLTLCIIDGSNDFEKGYFQAITDMKTAIKDLIKEKYRVEVE